LVVQYCSNNGVTHAECVSLPGFHGAISVGSSS
jgi:hypothetical protein